MIAITIGVRVKLARKLCNDHVMVLYKIENETKKNKDLSDEEFSCNLCFVEMKRNKSPYEINDLCKSNTIQTYDGT